jgi:hypothetical protein
LLLYHFGRPQPGRYRRISQHAFSADPVACKNHARNTECIDCRTALRGKDSRSNSHFGQKTDYLSVFAPIGDGKVDELLEVPAIGRGICTATQILAGV